MTTISDSANHWLPHLQTLHRHFSENGNDRCFLWVNPVQGDPFEMNELAQEQRVQVPIKGVNFDPLLAPYLVAIDLARSADADLFKTSVQFAWEAWTLDSMVACHGQPVGGWVLSDESPVVVAHYWGTKCHIHRVGTVRKLLRFHDPGSGNGYGERFPPFRSCSY